jgi:hypothetical protein
LKDRGLFLDTIDLAAHNMLFPGDPFFGVPALEVGPRDSRHTEALSIPPVLLKSIAWIESSITQTAFDIPFGSIGPALVAFDCGHGIAQVTSGMTFPEGEDGRGSPEQALVATHFAYNIARGAAILASKWNEAPETRPIAGIDTQGHPLLIENWYYAVWGYNGFTGPGANRSNHPMDPIYGTWPRTPYSCAPTGDGKAHNRANYPYQELVFGCAASPPVVDGEPLWQAQPISLPDLNQPEWLNPLRLDNFIFPYDRMDIPSPQPFHIDMTPAPEESLRAKVLGLPELDVSKRSVRLSYTLGGTSSLEIVNVENEGTGVLAWYAEPSVPWLNVTPYAGSAVGDDLLCELDAPCDRRGRLAISVDVATAPPGARTAQVKVVSLTTDETRTINVQISQLRQPSSQRAPRP